MPQTFQVLRCYKCAVFQVHPTKKSNKWKCKLCGEKQSIKRFYGIGTGKECRVHVQKLNEIRKDIDNAECETNGSKESTDVDEESETVHQAITKKRKWLNYVGAVNEDDKLNHSCPGETEIILEKPKKRPRKTLMESNETNLLSTKFLNNISNENIATCIQFNESTISHYNNVPLSPQTKKVDPNRCILNKTVQNSKWAQFMQDTQNCNDEDSAIVSNDSQDELKTLFSLLDDDDNLDAVLEL